MRLGCPIVEWQQEVRNNWLCSGGCWKEEYCRHGCSHTMKWDVPRGYYIARAWLTAASYGGLESISGYADYEMAEAHHDLEGTESYGERRYGGTRGGWFDETKNARDHPDTDPEQVKTYVDGRVVADDCNATEPREWETAESLLPDGFPASRDYTSHTYTTPNKTLEKYETLPAVPASSDQHNQWGMCADRVDITSQLSSRVGPSVEVTMTTAHTGRGNPTREAGTINAGRQAYDRGTYRFKSRATLFLHLAPENSLKPYGGPAYGTTHVRVGPDCLSAPAEQEGDCTAATLPDEPCTNTTVVCMFGQQTDWQGGYGGESGLLEEERLFSGKKSEALVAEDGEVSCISPDMTAKKDWQQLIVYRDTNGTKEGFERISHALGFFLYPHAPRHEDVRHAQVEPDLRRWQRSSVFSHRQGPELTVGSPGNQFEGRNRRRQVCPDPTDTDC